MLKVYFIAAFLLVAASTFMAAPLDGELEPLKFAVEEEGHADSQRRTIICDLFTNRESLEHKACAMRCSSLGKHGGYCANRVCLCRNYHGHGD